LVPGRQPADRVDAPEGVLKLDLRHNHGSQVL
jgi:hypothetical protein